MFENGLKLDETNLSVKKYSIYDSKQSNFDHLFPLELKKKNKIFEEIPRIAWGQLMHALAPVDNGTWELFVKDGEMQMYRMDHEEDDGIACDPLKAIHSVNVKEI